MPPPYEPGATLEVRDERWTLARVQQFDACTILTLGGAEGANASRVLRVVDPFDRPRGIADQAPLRRPRWAVLHAARCAIASARSATGLWAAATSAIDVWPYQLEPALAVVSGATRLLLADAVGLGKTIQAGLIVAELLARGWIERALIVCPAGLRDTWASELRNRFQLTAAILDPAAIAERLASVPHGINPWSGEAISITSIDFLKRPEVLAAVDGMPIDLLIADEAHHLAPGTERGATIARLAARVPWVVLMSATPHSGDTAAFTYLTGLGAHRDPLTIFRRTKHDAGLAVTRRCHVLPVHPTEPERALFGAVDRYARDIWRERGAGDHAVRLVAIVIARRAASSAAALERTLARRLDLLSGQPPEPLQPGLPWDESDTADDLDDDATLGAPGFAGDRDERRTLAQLLALARACAHGSKMRRLLRMLDAIHEPALVFTEYRDTLHAIVEGLPPSRRAGAIHGGMPAGLRREVVDRFNDGRLDVLIATDAAGEGLNLHRRCRLVIDFELPWNPLRLEQRAGRVDRIGQQRTVHIVRLFHPGTIEARVLDHLRIRDARAAEAIERCVAEAGLAEAIFDDRELAATAQPLPGTTTTPAANAEARRVIYQRQSIVPGTSLSHCWSSSRRYTRLVVLHRSTFANGAGYTIADRIAGQVVELRRRPRSRGQWRDAVEAISRRGRQALLNQQLALPARTTLTQRIASIRVHVAALRDVGYQRSLFDSRADADALGRATRAATLDASLARVAAAVDTRSTPATRVELVAAWPESRHPSFAKAAEGR